MSSPRVNFTIRSVLLWIHLALGISASLVILVLSLSGALLGYERQMIAWIDEGGKVVAAPGAERLPLDPLLERAAIPQATVANLLIKANPVEPVVVRPVEPRALPIMLDPFTGATVPLPIGGKARKTFSQIREWHLFLGSPEGSLRTAAHAASGAAMLALVLIVPLGMYLWWPARWTRAGIRATVVPRLNLRGRARNFNWHNSVGFWSAVPLFFVALTGVFLSYQWPGLWLDRSLGSPAEKAAAMAALNPTPRAPAALAQSAPPAQVLAEAAPAAVRDSASFSALFASVEREHPSWRSVTIAIPRAKGGMVQVTVAEGNTFRPDLRTSILLDPRTAAPARVVTYDSLSVSRRVRSWVRYTHTGEAFGLAGQTVATAASAGAVLLAWTGLALAWRRFSQWRAVRRRHHTLIG